jgi:hypothetical protein
VALSLVRFKPPLFSLTMDGRLLLLSNPSRRASASVVPYRVRLGPVDAALPCRVRRLSAATSSVASIFSDYASSSLRGGNDEGSACSSDAG